VHVHPRAEFDLWLERASDFLSRMSPAEAGRMLYEVRGCKQCHSADGSAGTGPTFRGLWGSRAELTSGERVEVDENYLRRSIVEPGSQVVRGYEPVMPTYAGRIKDQEIAAIAAYLETLR
jgi:cytochrome c oxidase subunit 2